MGDLNYLNFRDSQKIMVNRQVGHMLRTKMSTADEGGVAAGFGALDSPYLIDIDWFILNV